MWRPVPRAVDRRLIEDVRSAGGAVYRTHGFGYLYRRYGSQTWVKDLDYFLKASDYQWRGLRARVRRRRLARRREARLAPSDARLGWGDSAPHRRSPRSAADPV